MLCICTIYVYVCSCVTKERRCIRQRESSQAFTFIYLFDTNFITMHAYICLWSMEFIFEGFGFTLACLVANSKLMNSKEALVTYKEGKYGFHCA